MVRNVALVSRPKTLLVSFPGQGPRMGVPTGVKGIMLFGRQVTMT